MVTVAAVLGMAAHLEGKGVTSLDQTGLAQKNGAVMSHIRICDDPGKLYAVRIATAQARLLLACDMVVAAGIDTLSKLKPGCSHAIVNDHEAMPASFTHAPDMAFPGRSMHDTIRDHVNDAVDFLDATRLATTLLGDALAANMFLVGFAWQKGELPLAEASILRAIELNGALVEFNTQAFAWGRRAAFDRAAVERCVAPPAGETSDHRRLSQSLDELIARRVDHLTGYHDAAYAGRYRNRIDRVRAAERRAAPHSEELTEAAARSLAKLMSYKDEYEVARLFSDGGFMATLKEQFEDWDRLEIHLAPPLISRQKHRFGPWMLKLMPLLARLRILRGTLFDPFGHTAERRQERALIGEFEAVLEEVAAGLSPANHGIAVEIATLPRQIRGFGPIKTKAAAEYRERLAAELARFRAVPSLHQAAE